MISVLEYEFSKEGSSVNFYDLEESNGIPKNTSPKNKYERIRESPSCAVPLPTLALICGMHLIDTINKEFQCN